MWLHFPLEFAFLFTEHLAFWHADLLVRRAKMVRYAAQFAALPDGNDGRRLESPHAEVYADPVL